MKPVDVMTEGNIWTIKGIINGSEFEISFSDWDCMDPEATARTFYDGQNFLINTNLTVQRVIRSWPVLVDSKDGPETRESGGPCLGKE